MILTKKQLRFYLLADKIMAEPAQLSLLQRVKRMIFTPPHFTLFKTYALLLLLFNKTRGIL